jgi:hypothetical protein
MRTLAISLLAALPLLIPAPARGAGDGVRVTTVYRTGDPVPGLPDATVGGWGAAAIGDSGRVLATMWLAGANYPLGNNKSIVTWTPTGGLEIVGRENQPVPGIPNLNYRAAGINVDVAINLVVTPGGDIGVVPSMLDTVGGAFGLRGVLVGPANAPAPTLWESGPAPGYGAFPFSQYQERFTVRDGGATAVMGRVFDAGATVIWVGFPGAMTAALQTGLQAPGLPIGINIQSMADNSLRMDDQGWILFQATLPLGNGITQSNRSLLYLGPYDNVGVLARTGEVVPGVPGAVFTGFVGDGLRLNGVGALCYQAFVSGGGTDEVIITGGSGTYSALARDGEPAPGAPGTTLERVSRSRILMNGLGRVAFACKLAGAPAETDSAIFVGDPLGVSMVLREGDPMPGGGVAPDLQNVATRWTFNDRGQFAFILPVDGQDTLYATRPDGTMVRLARVGEALTTDDGFAAVVAGFSQDFDSGTQASGRTSWFNNVGEVVMPIRFVGAPGSGVFVFDVEQPIFADIAAPFGVLDAGDVAAAELAVLGGGPEGDFNADGVTDFLDMGRFLNEFEADAP